MDKTSEVKPDLGEMIVRRVVERAIRAAWSRLGLDSYEELKDQELTEDDAVQDAINLALGDDTGCLSDEEINAENIDVLWIREQLKMGGIAWTKQSSRN